MSGLAPPQGRRAALIVVDMQNDYVSPDGSVAVPNALDIVEGINELRNKAKFEVVCLTQDWHPKDHVSFFHTHADNAAASMNEPLTLPNGQTQLLKQRHCIADTDGAAFHPSLTVLKSDHIVRKGTASDTDADSAFCDRTPPASDGGVVEQRNTDLADILRRNYVVDVYITGVVFEDCVARTALHAAKEGFNTFILQDVTRTADASIDLAARNAPVLVALENAGVQLVTSACLLEQREDRRKAAMLYLEEQGIGGLFERLCASLVFHQPDDPRTFLMQEISRIQRKKGGRDEDLYQQTLYEDADLVTMFGMLDPVGTGTISSTQVREALRNLGIPETSVDVVDNVAFDVNEFCQLAKAGLSSSLKKR